MALPDLLRSGCRFAALALVAFSTIVMGADDVAERCANNKARLAELRQQIAAIQAWTPQQSRQVGDDLLTLTELVAQGEMSSLDYAKVTAMAVRYKFSQATCIIESKEKCAFELVKRIEQSQKDNNELMRQRKALMVEARRHEVNLVALACDAIRPDIEGVWHSMPAGDIELKASFEGSMTI